LTGLAGKIAVVTGASRGIGAAVADALASDGALVVGVARSFGTWTRGPDDPWTHARCDCTEAAEVDALARRVRETLGTPDLLVSNAGSFLLKPLAATTPEEFRAQLEANTVGPFLVLRAFLPGMMEAGRGHVVTIGSIVDHQAFPGNAAYAASKWGVRGLHEVARVEAAASGVRFTLLSPGATDTSLWDPFDPDARDDLPDRRGMLRPADVADAVRFVATRPPGAHVDLLRVSPRA